MTFTLNHLPRRTEKPRKKGMTLVLDKGYSVRQAEDVVESSSKYIDVVKLGWGTAYVTQELEEKIQVYQNADIPVYFGGTLFEAYELRDQLDQYVGLMNKYGIEHVEVSNGTIRLSDERKQSIIKELSQEFTVFSEVGSKNPNDILPPYKWVRIIEDELSAGAQKVICEARESGTVGVFRPNGEVRSGLIEEITDQIPEEKLIFEAPQKEQQVWFIRKFGSNVNLGNVQPADAISVETLRLGLRGDTLLDFFSLDDDEDLNHVMNDNQSISNKE